MPLYCCAGGGGPPSKDVFALREWHTILQAMYVLPALQPGWPKWDPDFARAEKVEAVRQIDWTQTQESGHSWWYSACLVSRSRHRIGEESGPNENKNTDSFIKVFAKKGDSVLWAENSSFELYFRTLPSRCVPGKKKRFCDYFFFLWISGIISGKYLTVIHQNKTSKIVEALGSKRTLNFFGFDLKTYIIGFWCFW